MSKALTVFVDSDSVRPYTVRTESPDAWYQRYMRHHR